jgi:hypothetical protein
MLERLALVMGALKSAILKSNCSPDTNSSATAPPATWGRNCYDIQGSRETGAGVVMGIRIRPLLPDSDLRPPGPDLDSTLIMILD